MVFFDVQATQKSKLGHQSRSSPGISEHPKKQVVEKTDLEVNGGGGEEISINGGTSFHGSKKQTKQKNMSNSEGPRSDRAFLDHLEAYLSRRDGVDKLLKITRYTCKFLLASPILQSPASAGKGSASSPALAALVSCRLKDFEASVGTSRKAFRLGKFVQDVNALRAVPSFSSRHGFLELVASGGEGIYYFIEQFIWLVKAGLLDKRHQKRLQLMSAWAEFIGYFGSVTLKSLQVQAMLVKESKLSLALNAGKDRDEIEAALRAATTLAEVRQKRIIKMLSLVQDLADALLALSDIRDGKGVLSNPLILSSCGLLSALISTHKNWLAC